MEKAKARLTRSSGNVFRDLGFAQEDAELTATALVAFIGDIRRFPSRRHLASYLGLTPREYSSGLKRYLGRISKRGDGYLRCLLIHGARSVLLTPGRDSLIGCASGHTSSEPLTSTTRPP